MTPRIVIPILSAIPTPIIIVISARHRPSALRIGYGRRRRRSSAAGSAASPIDGASAVLAIGRRPCAFEIQPAGFVDDNTERLFAGRRGMSIAGAEAALHQVAEHLCQRAER